MTVPKNITDDFIKIAASYTSVILRGIGQIMLQENQITGLLFLIGIFYGSFNMGCAALLATSWGTITANLLKYDHQEIEKGGYGFSAALVGVASILFLKPVLFTWILVILGSSLATIIQHFFIKRKIAVFTLPFVLVTWIIIYFSNLFQPDLLLNPVIANVREVNIYSLGFLGFAQVIFQDSFVSGLLFFIGVLISSRHAAIYAFAAGLLSAQIAHQLHFPNGDIALGLFSYNAVLCAIVFAGNHLTHLFWVIFSVLISVVVSLLLITVHLIPLTFPFVLACIVTLAIKGKIPPRFKVQLG